ACTPTPTTRPSPLSLHDALPISRRPLRLRAHTLRQLRGARLPIPFLVGLGLDLSLDQERRELAPLRLALEGHGSSFGLSYRTLRSEEHTSELQSRGHLVCRLLLE